MLSHQRAVLSSESNLDSASYLEAAAASIPREDDTSWAWEAPHTQYSAEKRGMCERSGARVGENLCKPYRSHKYGCSYCGGRFVVGGLQDFVRW